MARSDSRGTGAIQVLFGLAAGFLAAQLCADLGTSARTASSTSPDEATLGDAASAPHAIFLDDVARAGYSPDGLARNVGTFRTLTTGSDRDRIEFVADLDGDAAPELVRYEVRHGLLLRVVRAKHAGGWKMVAADGIAEDVVTFRLTFLDERRRTIPAAAVRSGDGPTPRSVYLRITTSAAGTRRTFGGEAALPKRTLEETRSIGF